MIRTDIIKDLEKDGFDKKQITDFFCDGAAMKAVDETITIQDAEDTYAYLTTPYFKRKVGGR